MSGSVGATCMSKSLLASHIPVRRPWLQFELKRQPGIEMVVVQKKKGGKEK